MHTEQLDLLAVTKALQTISGEIIFDKLLRTLLAVVLEQGGAERACLIQCQAECLLIEAEIVSGEKGSATTLLGAEPVNSSQHIPLSLVHYVRRTKEHVILSNAAADAGKFSGDSYFARMRPKSVFCIPILRQGEVVSLLYLENNLLADAFTPERLTALELLASQAAISLQNARFLQKEQAARALAEDAERQAAFIAKAGALLSESLDYEETLNRLTHLCVPSLCDWSFIDIVEDHEIRRVSMVHIDPAQSPTLDELFRRYPPRWDSAHPTATVLRTGESLLLSELPDEILRPKCVDDGHLRLLRQLGSHSAVFVPLIARGQTLGVLVLGSGEARRTHGSADLALAQEVAYRATLAIDNARLYREMQQAIHFRNEFLSVASHELNTPMTSLSLSLEAIARSVQSDRPLEPQVIRGRVDRALRQAKRLSRLNSELLDVTRIQANRFSLNPASVDLGAVVLDVVEQLKLDLTRAGCSVSIGASCRVIGHWDCARVDQIVTNLLTNALKFGAGKPIEIFLNEEMGVAHLAVRDHGIRVDPARQGKIFDQFERAVSDKHYGGLGLGLYISRTIAEAHGGSIRLQSALGAGATFIVELPCAGPPPRWITGRRDR